MYPIVTDIDRERAALIADALTDLVAELRLVEPGDFIGYIRGGQWANIADLIQSSAELHFPEGALTFGGTADYAADWITPPRISLDLEFQWDALSAFFTLFLERSSGSVEVKAIWFPSEPENARAGTAALAQAVRNARRSHAARASGKERPH